jgi:hypothetical protein
VRAAAEYRHGAAQLAPRSGRRTPCGATRSRLQEDPRTIEAVARGELGLVRRHEILVIVKDR